MTDRVDFEMTQADLDGILEAINKARNTPLIMLQCGFTQSPQEAANDAWAELGERMGFVAETACANGKGDRFFSAVPKQKERQL